ncbi:MAG: rhomboid family intramembrane serine protease [Chloroflexi bacterium]|nr:rhomboid family intramembrane serine protease [Chloroflexota bacterium]
MIPISDEPGRRLRFPFMNLALVALNIGIFTYQARLTEPGLEAFILSYGLVPQELTTGRDLPPLSPLPLWMTIFTAMFLHGGWLHLGGNMLYLWVFGDNVEDRLGHLKYLLFYLACGLVAALAQIAAGPASPTPMVGASGAIAGVLGAYLVLYPGSQVKTLLIAGGLTRLVPVPAFLLIGFWALLQLFNGLGSLAVETQQTGGVAYWAHVGGFSAGVLIVLLATSLGPQRRELLPGTPTHELGARLPPASRRQLLAASPTGTALALPAGALTVPGEGPSFRRMRRRHLRQAHPDAPEGEAPSPPDGPGGT